jgi:hypothetical protein
MQVQRNRKPVVPPVSVPKTSAQGAVFENQLIAISVINPEQIALANTLVLKLTTHLNPNFQILIP